MYAVCANLGKSIDNETWDHKHVKGVCVSVLCNHECDIPRFGIKRCDLNVTVVHGLQANMIGFLSTSIVLCVLF